jgi:predicted secreted hydrolase
MWYRLRHPDGSDDSHSKGLSVAADGSTQRLRAGDVVATALGSWSAADGSAVYPLPWRLAGPSLGFDLEVRPHVRDQELRLLVRYWEGAVTVTGARRGAPVRGVGYLEMTGYAR